MVLGGCASGSRRSSAVSAARVRGQSVKSRLKLARERGARGPGAWWAARSQAEVEQDARGVVALGGDLDDAHAAAAAGALARGDVGGEHAHQEPRPRVARGLGGGGLRLGDCASRR